MFGIPNPYIMGGVAAISVGIVIGAFAMGVKYEARGREIDRLNGQLAQKQVEIDTANLDLKFAQTSAAQARAAEQELADQAEQDQEEYNALLARLEGQPDVCRATAADVDSLLKFGPKPDAQGAGKKPAGHSWLGGPR